ncbi:YajQ family cyclic di-GMP-binding protein [Dietzia sp.]|uniref:YajQ family cyclic di-GMP-binding protein n=1 Tax=Dietzia sp. TaxID=1871616 RepID=UPI002FDA287B
MASESSFDVVSEYDRQEVDNALNQAAKEIGNRYDFRGTDTSLEWKGDAAIELYANAEQRLLAAKDVFIEKLVRRGISMKTVDFGDPMSSGKGYRMVGALKEGIDKENAKKITKLIRDEGPKGVKATVQGEEVRVSSKSRDDLQAVIALLKGADLEVALQFQNYR